ncbi:MAG: hypothetical protein ROO76_15180 [Terriglobia bacterium]|jgi:hypothetical protein|nr:hypothetical protein [Terriglobia bacterium]
MDWLRVFGFAPEKIPELQLSLPSKRTILLDSSLDDGNSWVPWFRNVTGEPPPRGIVPLGQLVGFSSFRRLESLTRSDDRDFLYAKVGRQDALAFPELLPGSIVRVNPQISDGLLQGEKGRTLKSVFLIEHSKGLWCCRVHVSETGRIVPISDQLPYAHIEFQVPRDMRVLGIVDMEIRRTHAFAEPDVPEELANAWKPERIDRQHGGLGPLLRRTRRQAALSFREASTRSRRLADLLGDERYFASPGSLSDYEVADDPPRHFHKVITLCALYGIRFLDLIAAAGINMEEMGRDAIPNAGLTAMGLTKVSSDFAAVKFADHDPDLTRLMAQFKELPFFLRGSLETLSGIKELSIRDFFWTGTKSRLFYPSLRGALLIIVNRHKKKPFRSITLQQWQQPLYMLVRRDGTYFCASCSLDEGILVIHANQPDSQQSERVRNHNDVEVIGEVVTIVRRIP